MPVAAPVSISTQHPRFTPSSFIDASSMALIAAKARGLDLLVKSHEDFGPSAEVRAHAPVGLSGLSDTLPPDLEAMALAAIDEASGGDAKAMVSFTAARIAPELAARLPDSPTQSLDATGAVYRLQALSGETLQRQLNEQAALLRALGQMLATTDLTGGAAMQNLSHQGVQVSPAILGQKLLALKDGMTLGAMLKDLGPMMDSINKLVPALPDNTMGNSVLAIVASVQVVHQSLQNIADHHPEAALVRAPAAEQKLTVAGNVPVFERLAETKTAAATATIILPTAPAPEADRGPQIGTAPAPASAVEERTAGQIVVPVPAPPLPPATPQAADAMTQTRAASQSSPNMNKPADATPAVAQPAVVEPAADRVTITVQARGDVPVVLVKDAKPIATQSPSVPPAQPATRTEAPPISVSAKTPAAPASPPASVAPVAASEAPVAPATTTQQAATIPTAAPKVEPTPPAAPVIEPKAEAVGGVAVPQEPNIVPLREVIGGGSQLRDGDAPRGERHIHNHAGELPREKPRDISEYGHDRAGDKGYSPPVISPPDRKGADPIILTADKVKTTTEMPKDKPPIEKVFKAVVSGVCPHCIKCPLCSVTPAKSAAPAHNHG